MVTKGIISEFAAESAFLWFIRTKAVIKPHYSLADVSILDERLEAHIDGLRVADEAGWQSCKKNFGSTEPENYFAPSVLAFESDVADRIQEVFDEIGESREKAHAVISALAWIPFEQAEPHLNSLLVSESSFHRYIGIAASAAHRHGPELPLDKMVYDPCPLLVARTLRAYGELGRSSELTSLILREGLSDDDDGIRFSTAWSAALGGNSEAVEVLKGFVVPESPYREKALNTALRRMEHTTALSWLKLFAEKPDWIRLAVIGAGIIGDPVLVPWLIEQMQTPAFGRVAGEAFTLITGADIEQDELGGGWPEGFVAGPSDDPKDDNIAMDADDDLPWPNDKAIAQWWDRNKGAFPVGTRHLMGKPIAADQLWHVLRTGRQRQRCAAALELAILEPGRPLFEVRARGSRQLEVLK